MTENARQIADLSLVPDGLPSTPHEAAFALERARAIAWLNASGGLCAVGLLVALVVSSGEIILSIDLALFLLAISLGIAGSFTRRGRLELGQTVASVNLASLIAAICSVTGGLDSFMVPWLAVLPVGAGLAASSMKVLIASVFSVAVLGGLYAGDYLGVLPAPRLGSDLAFMHVLSLVFATGYAGALATAGWWLSRWSEGAVAATENRYRLLAENVSDMFSVHERDGRAEFVSIGAERLFGQSPQRLQGEAFLEAIHVNDRQTFLDACDEAVSNGREKMVEVRFRRGDGTDRKFVWVECRCRPIASESNDERLVVATRDVTNRKAAERALHEARDVAERADRAKSRFLASVTHELRTPLNAVIGFSDILKGELAPGASHGVAPELAEYVELINDSGQHLLSVVNDLLDMSKIEAGQYVIVPEEIDLRAMLEATIRTLSPIAGKDGVNIELDLSPRLGKIIADRRAMRQIVLNILSNAIKFSNAGGTVFVGAGTGDTGATIWVRDEGIGIAKEDIARLGEPFFQADSSSERAYEGTGLGLSVVKGLISLQGGSLLVESTPGVGTTVRISLPNAAIAAGTEVATRDAAA